MANNTLMSALFTLTVIAISFVVLYVGWINLITMRIQGKIHFNLPSSKELEHY